MKVMEVMEYLAAQAITGSVHQEHDEKHQTSEGDRDCHFQEQILEKLSFNLFIVVLCSLGCQIVRPQFFAEF